MTVTWVDTAEEPDTADLQDGWAVLWFGEFIDTGLATRCQAVQSARDWAARFADCTGDPAANLTVGDVALCWACDGTNEIPGVTEYIRCEFCPEPGYTIHEESKP